MDFEVVGRKKYDNSLAVSECNIVPTTLVNGIHHFDYIPGYDQIGDWDNVPAHKLNTGDYGIVVSGVTDFKWSIKHPTIETERHKVSYIQVEVADTQYWIIHHNFYLNCSAI